MLAQKLIRTLKTSRREWIVQLLCLLLITDICFIFLHLLYAHTDLLSNRNFSVGTDRGYSEIFQYLKEFWIALLLGAMAVRLRSLVYVSWSILFFFLLLDDAVQIHERLGDLIGANLTLPIASAFLDDIGELLVAVLIGVIFLMGLAITYPLGDRLSKQTSKYLVLFLVVLAGFGVAVDIVHALLQFSPFESFLVLLEDAGELVTMSAILSYVLSLSASNYQSAKFVELPSQYSLSARK